MRVVDAFVIVSACYDAWYVALAEMFACPLATLDGRLSRATGPQCQFATPPPSR